MFDLKPRASPADRVASVPLKPGPHDAGHGNDFDVIVAEDASTSLLDALTRKTERQRLVSDDIPLIVDMDRLLWPDVRWAHDAQQLGPLYRAIVVKGSPTRDRVMVAVPVTGLRPAMRTSARILSRVQVLHQLRRYTVAADLVLNYLVDLLDGRDFSAIDELLSEFTSTLERDREMQGDRGLALALNLLTLTSRHDAHLRNRSALRDALRSCVAKSEGPAAAAAAVASL